jgi:hypothetical protein
MSGSEYQLACPVCNSDTGDFTLELSSKHAVTHPIPWTVVVAGSRSRLRLLTALREK